MSTYSKVNRLDQQALPVNDICARETADLRFICLSSLLLGLLVLTTACNSTTVFQANFSSDTPGSAPATTQATGTILLSPGSGTITVVDAPAAGLPANKWVRVSHPSQPTPETVMKGEFSRFDGLGNYGFLASLYIPTGTGAVTVQFETFGRGLNNSPDFLHLDFMPAGNIRIDDDDSRTFGHFPRDQVFVLSVNLVITATNATAHISLLGAGTSGSIDVNIQPNRLTLARQFGSVRIWMGFQWTGIFFVDDILVTRRND
jgi:hypothetical protein